MMDQYLGGLLSMGELADRGYAQHGYGSILRLDTWKAQKCANHTMTCSERIDEVTVHIGGNVKVSRLRSFVEAMEAAEIEEVDVDASELSGSDCCEVYGSLDLYATRTYESAKSDSMYLMEYYDYVVDVHRSNVEVWEAYMKTNALDARVLEEKATYLKLRAKYAKEFGHV